MKIFRDLSNIQFIELHRLAWNLEAPVEATVSAYCATISVWQVRDCTGRMTEFNGVTGEIFRLPANGVHRIWPIISKCREWGIDYSSHQL